MILLLTSAAVLLAQDSTIWLEDQAPERGVAFTWVSGDTGSFNMPEIIGGGAALLDYDNDGDLDIYFVQGGHLDTKEPEHNVLLRNDDGKFVDVTAESKTGDTGYGMGVATGDFNNDSFIDLFVTNVGKNVLLKNNGDGTYSDVTDEAGVGDTGWGASAAFADFDADGYLDVYAINYLVWEHGLDLDCFNAKGALDYCSPTNYMAPAKDLLYKNNGDGTFTNMSEQAGIGTRTGTGLGVLCNDYTGDGKIDIYVANDGMADQLWQNNGNWSFTDVAAMRGCGLDDEGRAKAGMGVTTDDIDNDGDLDILVCNLFGESDSLYQNEGDYFIDNTARRGIRTATRHATRFGLGWVDFNNDGYLDLYEANGRVQQIGSPLTADPFAEPNFLLEGSATKWVPIQGVKNQQTHTSRAAAFGDIDNDGGIDVLVVNRDAPAYLLMNVHPSKKNGVTFRILDAHNRDALGAVVSAKVNGETITHPVQSAWSYMAANDPRVHFGLRDDTEVQNVKVRWVDGTTTDFGKFTSGFHTLRQN
jgi:enediyne biosynthesis protein E4